MKLERTDLGTGAMAIGRSILLCRIRPPDPPYPVWSPIRERSVCPLCSDLVSLLPALYTGLVAGNRFLPTDHSYPLGRRRPMVICVVTSKITGLYLPKTRCVHRDRFPRCLLTGAWVGLAGPGVSPIFPQAGYPFPVASLDRVTPTVFAVPAGVPTAIILNSPTSAERETYR